MRRFIAATVVRPVTTTMVTVAVLLFGLVAATRLAVDLLPDLSYPTITVQTELPDAAPAEVEELLTRPIEERVGAVPGVVRIESASREGRSEVVLDFAWGTRVDQAMADIREKLDRVTLPTEATRPVVLRYDPAAEPIMRLALTGAPETASRLEARDLALMRDRADRSVKRELEKLGGVAAVQLHGGEEDEVLVEVDPARLAALEVTSQEVGEAIRRDNVNRPGGAITERRNRYLVRTLHEARTAEELAELIVRSEGGRQLRLRDLAKVRRVPQEREEVTLVDGREAVELAVYREGDANTVAVSDRVRAMLPRLPLPAGERVVVLSDQSDFIEAAITEVGQATVVGGALAIIVLLFFLRDLRSTLVIAAAIPISLLATFVPLRALDVSLNLMSLGGLALGVGMLVDNSIVVLESIARVRERAREASESGPVSGRETAVEGTAEVAPSVVASTLTTVAVFLPMAFVEGVAGQLVRDLSLAVSFSLLSSLVVSVTLVPVLQAIGSGGAAQTEDQPVAPLAALAVIPAGLWWVVRKVTAAGGFVLELVTRPLSHAYQALENRYPAVLRVALRHRLVTLIAAAGVCVVSVDLAMQRGQTLLPEVEQEEFFVQLSLPQGAALQRTTEAVLAMTRAIEADPAVGSTFGRAGSVTQAGSASGVSTGHHLGQVNVRMADVAPAQRAQTRNRLFAAMLEANPEPQAAIRLDEPALFSFVPPIEIQVFADDVEAAVAHAQRLLGPLQDAPDLSDIVPDDLAGRPEVRVRFDRQRLSRLGITVDDAAAAVARAIAGEVVTTMYSSDRQLDVRVRLPTVNRESPADVGRIVVAVSDGVPVRLQSVAKVVDATGPAEIHRIDGRRGLRIQARVAGVDLAAAARQAQEILDAHEDDDETVTTAIAGQADEMAVSLRSLAFTAALAVFLVYVVMASSFESLLHPFLIMFTVPLALAGVAFALHVVDIPVSAMVGIGVIVLGGIVVNNAIVLINAVNDRRGSGMSVTDALVEAGAVRVRPILMTTLTTILGLLPMAIGIGEGASLRQPLAVAVIGGLGVATVLTLVVMPCAYSLLPGKTRDAWGRKGA